MNSSLPIELVPGNTPPRFRWQHTTSTPVGERTVECEGLAPTSMERALVDLISLCERQAQEIAGLHRQVNSLEVLNTNQKVMLDQREQDDTRRLQSGAGSPLVRPQPTKKEK